MSRGQHAAGDRSFGRSAGGAMARGVALIVAAVVLGVVLLNQTDKPTLAKVAAKETTTTTTTPAGSTTTTVATPKAARNPAQVTVLVANGSGVAGAGARTADKLKAANYLTAAPTNAVPAVVSASAVYYVAGYELDARAVAALLKPTPKVAVMPTPVPVGSLGGAQVLVVVAADLAKA